MDPNGIANLHNQTISFPQISKKQFWSSHSCWWNPRIFMVKLCLKPHGFPHVFQWKIAFARRCHRLLPEEAGKPWRAHLRSLAHRGTGWDGRDEFSQGVKLAIKVGTFGKLDVGNDQVDIWWFFRYSFDIQFILIPIELHLIFFHAMGSFLDTRPEPSWVHLGVPMEGPGSACDSIHWNRAGFWHDFKRNPLTGS